MSLLSRSRIALALAVAGFVAGCSADVRDEGGPAVAGNDDGGGSEVEVAATEDEVRASCTQPKMYFVAVAEGTCAPVPGKGGRWVPEDLFADAPAEVKRFACAYRWRAGPSRTPDRAALEAALGSDAGLAPVCGVDATLVPVRSEVTETDFTPGTMAGSVGCDVCGFVWGDKLFTVLPPETVLLRTVEVRTVNAGLKAYQINETRARAVVTDLPPVAGGYLPGRVPVY